jgi:hypothetical protein
VLALVAGFAVAAAACTSQPDGAAGQRAYVERLGDDTVAVEVFTRTADGFEGDLLVRSPVTRVAHYRATLSPAGTIDRMDVEWVTPAENPDGPESFGFTVLIEGDSATIEFRGGDNPGTRRIAAPAGAIPLVGRVPISYAVMEQAVSQAMASGADSFPINFVAPGRARIVPNAITRMSANTVSYDFFGSPFMAEVDESGRVLGRTGERTTMKAVGEPVMDIDLASLAGDFAARDARGEGMGIASPQATVDAGVGAANLQIVYSRPAMRGREIWGGLVPFNEVWRTGANAATSFSSDRNLDIGGVAVPAGDYTLFSIYTPDSAYLIINRQTGQWGTVYSVEQDLARVDMSQESLAEPMERFTISVESTQDGGVLQLSWDRTRFSVPITVR